MGRLCGGAHEISGIKAPLFLHGWVGGGGVCGLLVRDVVGGGRRVVVSDAPHDGGHHGGHVMPPMVFLFLEKNYAFDWKDNFCS